MKDQLLSLLSWRIKSMTIAKKVLFPLFCTVLLMGNSSCLESCDRSAPVYEGDYPVGASAVIRWADNKGIIDITFQNDTNKSIKDINVWLERYRSFDGHTYKSLDEEYQHQFSGENVWLELFREDEHVSRLVDDG